jgi:hypothetical protein
MAPRIGVFAVVLVFALIGCDKKQESAAGSGSPQAFSCTPSNCKVAVTVTGDCSNASQISVSIDPLPVPRQFHGLKIDFDIQTNGFAWVDQPNGITFTAPPIPPAGEFTNPHNNARHYDITDANTQTVPTPFKYDIHLKRDNGTLCAVKDPSIANGS